MVIKIIPLYLTTIPDDILFAILDDLKSDIDSLTYDLDVDKLILYMSKDDKDKFNKLIKDLYNEALSEFFNVKYSNEYRVLNAKIINFLDKLLRSNLKAT